MFEINLPEGFRPTGPRADLGRLCETVGSAAEAAKMVLDKVKEAWPHQTGLTSGIKASVEANCFVVMEAGGG